MTDDVHPDDLWLDMHRALAGDQAAAHRVDQAFTVDGPCPKCGSTRTPLREQHEITSLGDPEPSYIQGLYVCAACVHRTAAWPRVPIEH